MTEMATITLSRIIALSSPSVQLKDNLFLRAHSIRCAAVNSVANMQPVSFIYALTGHRFALNVIKIRVWQVRNV